MSHVRKTNVTECRQGWGGNPKAYVASGNVIGTTALQNCLAVANNVKHTPVWPKNFIIGHKPKGNKCNAHKSICTGMFLVALFVTAQTWKLPKCSSIGYDFIRFSCFVLSNIAMWWNFSGFSKLKLKNPSWSEVFYEMFMQYMELWQLPLPGTWCCWWLNYLKFCVKHDWPA